MPDESGDGSRRAWLIVAGVLVLLVLTMALLMVLGVNPCKEDLAAHTPQVGYNVSYNTSSQTLTVVHEAGDRLTAYNTNSVNVRMSHDGNVRISYGGTDEDAIKYVLASDSTGGYPLEPTDRWTFSNVTIHGRPLSDGDVILVEWRGPGEDVPIYCPNHGEDSEVVQKLVIGEGE